MARQLRKKSGTGIYHVMVRGINRQDIFEDEEDYLQMVSILRALSDRHDEQGLRLPPLSIFYAYCLMSNFFLKEKGFWTKSDSTRLADTQFIRIAKTDINN